MSPGESSTLVTLAPGSARFATVVCIPFAGGAPRSSRPWPPR